MDPNLYHLDWEQVAEVLATIIVLAFIIERALVLLFEFGPFAENLAGKGAKEPIAFAVSAFVCWYWSFDALSVILHRSQVGLIGELLTAAVIAGGSKASLKLFRDVMGIESEKAKLLRQRSLDAKKAQAPTGTPTS